MTVASEFSDTIILAEFLQHNFILETENLQTNYKMGINNKSERLITHTQAPNFQTLLWSVKLKRINKLFAYPQKNIIFSMKG